MPLAGQRAVLPAHGSHLYDDWGKLIEVDYSRHDLPAPVEPGETMRLTIDVALPGPGEYQLAFDLVSEGVMWFENQGSKPIRVDVCVLPQPRAARGHGIRAVYTPRSRSAARSRVSSFFAKQNRSTGGAGE
jgi:hypothetical protein